MSILAAVLNQEPKPASEISRALPHDLEKIITRCLRKDPSRRFQHMADLKVALEELKEESDSRLLSVKEGADSSGKPRRFSLLRWVTIAVAGVSLAVAGWFWFGRSEKAPPEGPLTAVPLTAYPGWELSPSFSPDGNQVAFVQAETADNQESTSGNTRHLHQADWSGRTFPADRQSGSGSEPCLVARWPNHRLRASVVTGAGCLHREATKGRAGAHHRGVYGSKRRSQAWLFSIGHHRSVPGLPDSKGLVVVGMKRRASSVLSFWFSLETAEKRPLMDPPSGLGDTDPAISPDGRALVFSRMESTRSR